MSEYAFDIYYVDSKQNVLAEYLSRLVWEKAAE